MNRKMSNKINRVLLTGAAGGLGKVLRPRLAPLANKLRLSDVANLGDVGPDEELVHCDLGDFDAMLALLDGVDSVVHLGGMSIDGPFEPILNANIRGVYNLYEAARIKGTRRVLFASSNHVVGFHKQSERIDADALLRPDGNYGVSKAFGEAASRFYFDRYGIETVCMRIVVPEAPGQAHDVDVAELRRSDQPCNVRTARAGGWPHHRLRGIRQQTCLVGQQQGRAS